jgi:hypothetical protein
MKNFAQNAKYAPAMATQGAGTGDTLNGTAIDTQGYRRATFIVKFGAIVGGATNALHVEGDSVAAFNVAPADITGATVTVADDDDNQVAVIEVVNPTAAHRFLRLVDVRAGGQNTTIDGAVCVLTDGGQYPVVQDATLVSTGAVTSVADN